MDWRENRIIYGLGRQSSSKPLTQAEVSSTKSHLDDVGQFKCIGSQLFRKLLENEVKIGSNRFGMAPNIDILGLAFWASLGRCSNRATARGPFLAALPAVIHHPVDRAGTTARTAATHDTCPATPSGDGAVA